MTERRLADRRRARRQRRAALLAILAIMAAAGLYFAVSSSDEGRAPQAMDTQAPPLVDTYAHSGDDLGDLPAPTPGDPTPPLYYSGTGTWTYAEPSRTGAFGRSGTLLRYNVAVEDGIAIDAQDFSDFVAVTLADARSWTAGGAWRFQQVGASGADFTVYLASPEQRSVLCSHPNTTVSCRNGDKVVINSARWITGVDHWDGTLDSYREYVVNHEVGHRLGQSHEICPAKGSLSPVMAQQTFQLAGCVGNAWPYPDGSTYLAGPPGEYGGPDLPPDDYADS
ncbi:zinc metalloprotease [Glycomyces tarimensis]